MWAVIATKINFSEPLEILQRVLEFKAIRVLEAVEKTHPENLRVSIMRIEKDHRAESSLHVNQPYFVSN